MGEWVVRVEPLLAGGSPQWVEHPTLGAQADFVGLPLTQLADVQLYPYDLENTGPAFVCGPADAVSVIGFPFALQAGGSFAVSLSANMSETPTTPEFSV